MKMKNFRIGWRKLIRISEILSSSPRDWKSDSQSTFIIVVTDFSVAQGSVTESSHNIYEVLQAAVWKDTVNRNLQKLQDKVDGYHRDTEQFKGKINVFVSQKLDFSEERDAMMKKVLNLEREKEKLLR